MQMIEWINQMIESSVDDPQLVEARLLHCGANERNNTRKQAALNIRGPLS